MSQTFDSLVRLRELVKLLIISRANTPERNILQYLSAF